MIFVDREEELRVLREALSSARAELVLLYGRRRIGKTFLVSRLLREVDGIYLCVNHEERDLALRDLVEQFLSQVSLPVKPSVSSFRELFKLLAISGRRLIVIDEFQRLLRAGGITELQHLWDLELSRSGTVLVLSGSAVGVAERIGLSHASPLFGRFTRVIRLEEFSYSVARAFTPSYSEEDKVRTYSVFGGVPGYLSLLKPTKNLLENITSLVLGPGAPLREEPLTALRLELRNPSRYIEVLRAVAMGATQFGEIADKAGLRVTELPKYLRILEEDLRLVERRYPLLEEGSRRRARYYVRDHFTSFWFNAVYPNRPLLELGMYREVAGRVPEVVERLASAVFEKVAMEHFATLAKSGEVSFTRMGKWWSGETEIDFIAIDEKSNTAYFAEVKWTNERVHRKVLYRLMEKAAEFPWREKDRKEVYVVYSRSGFTFEPEEGLRLYTLADLREAFEKVKPQVTEL
jgi:AAA+ ATPase superfamily predicted ATPase